MLFKAPVLAAIAEGQVSLAFRRWRKPTVRTGGSLTTPAGVLAIDRVEVVEQDAALHAVARKLAKMGPWTFEVLRLISDNPGVRAADLAARLERVTQSFKADVRKLKATGPTGAWKSDTGSPSGAAPC